jgi:threonylcarbamoyladenosine tRNA methylthiotransferase MtaB
MKIYLDTVGCRLNQAEIESMAMKFRTAGHEIVGSPINADLVVINTCTVTAAAASDSRQKARQANKAGNARIVMTGCWATISPREALDLPGVESVFVNSEKDTIPARIMGLQAYEMEPLDRKPLPGIHKRTRAFIKVQDGCDNHCTFCITRIARGGSRSVGKTEILEQVHNAEMGGTHEIVLTGVNLGAWGKDLKDGEGLRDLIHFLLQNSQIERVRLSSIEPWDMDDEFLDLWIDERMCRHFHISLQSGCAETLKRMGRKTTPEMFRGLIQSIRRKIPDAAITTDVIVGFAGETDEQFKESLDFVSEIHFAGGHVFRFSPHEGTPAAQYPGRVHGQIAHERSEEMRKVFEASELAYRQKFIGGEVSVLWELSKEITNGKWLIHGLTDNYLPVTTRASEDRWNRIDRVRLGDITGESIEGILVDP